MRTTGLTLFAVLASVSSAIACGGGGGAAAPASTPTTAANPPGDTAIARHLSVPAVRLGHYSSGDGMNGFVLDRSGGQPKVKMDGFQGDHRGPSPRAITTAGKSAATAMCRRKAVDPHRQGRRRRAEHRARPRLDASRRRRRSAGHAEHQGARARQVAYELKSEELTALSVLVRFPDSKTRTPRTWPGAPRSLRGRRRTWSCTPPEENRRPGRPRRSGSTTDRRVGAGVGGYPIDIPWDGAEAGLMKLGGVLKGDLYWEDASVAFAWSGSSVTVRTNTGGRSAHRQPPQALHAEGISSAPRREHPRPGVAGRRRHCRAGDLRRRALRRQRFRQG